jgi:galactokinase
MNENRTNEKMRALSKKMLESLGCDTIDDAVFISAPGRMEMLGNHTDHQHGFAIAASVDREIFGIARPNGSETIRIRSEGYPLIEMRANDLSVRLAENGDSAAIARGVARGIADRGYPVSGFDACIVSDVPKGSGLSSSASFEIWVASAINELFCDGELSPVDLAKIAQYAENVYFGKPSGLEDQIACSVGGVLFIDFEDPNEPLVENIDATFDGYTLVVTDSGANHANLTQRYASIPEELERVCAFFGKNKLREVKREEVLRNIPVLRKVVGDRAVLRALHVFEENERVLAAREALESRDTETFLSLVADSGASSFMYLQNVLIPGEEHDQALALTLGVCNELLAGAGAFRIQGGGFAGTVEAYVPDDALERFIEGVNTALGPGSCHILSVRNEGAGRVDNPFA